MHEQYIYINTMIAKVSMMRDLNQWELTSHDSSHNQRQY